MTSLRERLDEIANSVTGGDLLDGARLYRESMARARRRRTAVASVATAAVVATVAVVASLVNTGGKPTIAPADPLASVQPSGPSEVQGACPAGEERAVFPGTPKDQSASILLGCGRLDDGRKVELLSMARSGGLCLQIIGIDDRLRECGNAPSALVPPVTRAVAAQAIAQRNNSAALEVYGAVSADITTVILGYTVDGSPRRVRAELIRARNSEVLERAGISEPFGYFLGELPPKTSKVKAIGLDSQGHRLGEDDFEAALQSQPRGAMIGGRTR